MFFGVRQHRCRFQGRKQASAIKAGASPRTPKFNLVRHGPLHDALAVTIAPTTRFTVHGPRTLTSPSKTLLFSLRLCIFEAVNTEEIEMLTRPALKHWATAMDAP